MIVGIDISKDWFDITWQDADQLKNQRFPYTEAGMVQLLEQLPAEAIYVMEATGTYHARLAVTLFEAGRKVSVVNALIIKRYAQMKLRRVKSDPADAALIMQFAQHEAPPLWAPASEEVQELQQAHGWLNDLITERTRLLNRQQAHAHRQTQPICDQTNESATFPKSHHANTSASAKLFPCASFTASCGSLNNGQSISTAGSFHNKLRSCSG